jgi:hypothetical protein
VITADLLYLPPVSWFAEVIKHDDLVLEQFDSWQKSSFRNKTIIAGPNTLQTLSVPIVGGRNQKGLYKDIKICYTERWPNVHINAIRTAYGSAPFYEYYADSFYEILRKERNYLFDLNEALLNQIIKTLKLNISISKSTDYRLTIEEGATDLRNRITAKTNFQPQKTYIQVFSERHGFRPNVSILDLIFHEGPNAANYLRGL